MNEKTRRNISAMDRKVMEATSKAGERPRLAVLIDADNVGPSAVDALFRIVCRLGEPIIRRAYGTPQRFMGEGGWQLAQRTHGVVACPQVSNLQGKNAADIALVIDAMECLYTSPCEGICIVSSDSDYTALAAKFREAGKLVYGIGSAKTPKSFRVACTQYIVLPKTPKIKPSPVSEICPRCGGELGRAITKSHRACRTCATCGGISAKLGLLQSTFGEESIARIMAEVRNNPTVGCVCPDCGHQMSVVRLASGEQAVEVDVCGNCKSVWYDKSEYEALVPEDGLLSATVSSGKSFRREVVAQIAADLRTGRLTVKSAGALRKILQARYRTSSADNQSILGALCNRQVISLAPSGGLTVLPEKV